MKNHDNLRPFPTHGIQLHTVGDEIILMHAAGEKVFHGNQTAALIWQLCDGQRTIQEIAELLCEAYPDAPSGVIPHDVKTVLSQLHTNGAIRWM